MASRNSSSKESLFPGVTVEGGFFPPDALQDLGVSGRISSKNARDQARDEFLNPEGFDINPLETLEGNCQLAFESLRARWTHFTSQGGPVIPRWLGPLLHELHFGHPAPLTLRLPEAPSREYPFSGLQASVPLLLVDPNQDLDKPFRGRSSPHGFLQEFLNKSSEHLYGIVSNGKELRLLRDNARLTRPAYLSFDLDGIFSGGEYASFSLLFRLAHSSRFRPRQNNRPDSCLFESWIQKAGEKTARALEHLRNGVRSAIEAMGRGFLLDPSIATALREDSFDKDSLKNELLRLVYRFLFLLVAEERDLLFPDDADPGLRHIYQSGYSITRLRKLAQLTRGSSHHDLYESMKLLLGALAEEKQARCLGLAALGGLFKPRPGERLTRARLPNEAMLLTIRHLTLREVDGHLRPIDYFRLGAEELGGVYEQLLGLDPYIDLGNPTQPVFEIHAVAGNERKTSGSYYTPDSLVQCLLDSALEPVMAQAIQGKNPQDAARALLNLKVCDPACGSGHFLVGAGRRLAARLAEVQSGGDFPGASQVRHAFRQVASQCIYGVDLNPMAVELCKVALWMEAMEPGKPLSFLDHQIQCGNSLLGTTPSLLNQGIPDAAFTPIEGDVNSVVTSLKRDNKRQREDTASNQKSFFAPIFKLGTMAAEFSKLGTAQEDTLADVDALETAYTQLVQSGSYANARLLADTWCAAFVWKKDDTDLGRLCPTERTFRSVEDRGGVGLVPIVRAEVERLRDQYRFFHWHLAFPDVFGMPGKDETPENELTGWSSGFDVMLGNPPWERVKLQEKEWFAERSPEIANAPNSAARKRMIRALQTNDPELFERFRDATRLAEGESHLMRNTGRYPLCGRGDINLYAVFGEMFLTLTNTHGRSGVLLPCGIATDDTTKYFFQSIMENSRLHALFGFINEEMLFPTVLHNFKFALLILGGQQSRSASATIAFNCYNVEQSKDDNRRFTLTRYDVELLNPNTKTCPVFFWKRSAEITKAIYRRVQILRRDSYTNPWAIKFGTMFHMSNDSGLFETEPGGDAERVPLYEAKMFDQYNHRYASYEHLAVGERSHMLPPVAGDKLTDPEYAPRPCYYVKATDVDSAISEYWQQKWLIGYREITSAGLWRTTIYSVLPRYGASNKIPLVYFEQSCLAHAASYLACMNSFVLDFVSRQKLGGASFSFFIKYQLPVVIPQVLSTTTYWVPNVQVDQWLLPRVLELTYTAWDLKAFARDSGYDGPPFHWDEERRFLLRCELDAAFFHLYLHADMKGDWVPARQADGCPIDESTKDLALLTASFPTPRDAASYIMDTFPIVRRNDEEKYNGDYRTKRVILEIYDEMQEANRTGQPYQTRLDPPPGPPNGPLPEWKPGQPKPANWPSHIHAPRGCRATPTDEWRLSEMNDGATLPPSFKVVLEGPEATGGIGRRWKGKLLGDSDSLPEPDSWVLVRHPDLKRGSTAVPVALGKLSYQELTDAATRKKVMVVTLRGPVPPAQVRIPLEDWPSFRPLAVLEPLDS